MLDFPLQLLIGIVAAFIVHRRGDRLWVALAKGWVLRVLPKVCGAVVGTAKKETSTGIQTLKWIERGKRRCLCGLHSKSRSIFMHRAGERS